MANYHNLRNVLHGYYPLIHGVDHLVVLHGELVVEIKKAQSRFDSIHLGVPLTAFCWEKISPAVRIHYYLLKKGVDEHYRVSLPGI